MARVTYTQTLQRCIEVEVSDEQLAALRDPEHPGHDDARQAVVDAAVSRQDEHPVEFVMASCMDEQDEELFDVG